MPALSWPQPVSSGTQVQEAWELDGAGALVLPTPDEEDPGAGRLVEPPVVLLEAAALLESDGLEVAALDVFCPAEEDSTAVELLLAAEVTPAEEPALVELLLATLVLVEAWLLDAAEVPAPDVALEEVCGDDVPATLVPAVLPLDDVLVPAAVQCPSTHTAAGSQSAVVSHAVLTVQPAAAAATPSNRSPTRNQIDVLIGTHILAGSCQATAGTPAGLLPRNNRWGSTCTAAGCTQTH